MRYMNYGPNAGERVAGHSPSPKMNAPENNNGVPDSVLSSRYSATHDIIGNILEEINSIPVEGALERLDGEVDNPIQTVASCTTIERQKGRLVVTGVRFPKGELSKEAQEFLDEYTE